MEAAFMAPNARLLGFKLDPAAIVLSEVFQVTRRALTWFQERPLEVCATSLNCMLMHVSLLNSYCNWHDQGRNF